MKSKTNISSLCALIAGAFACIATTANAADPVARLEVFENDNQSKPIGPIFYQEAGEGRAHTGSYKDLDDREIEWNDKIRSVILYGPAGTTVWLYDSKNFGTGDDILEIKIPEGKTSVTINNLDSDHPTGVTWHKKNNGIAGKVSGIQWK